MLYIVSIILLVILLVIILSFFFKYNTVTIDNFNNNGINNGINNFSDNNMQILDNSSGWKCNCTNTNQIYSDEIQNLEYTCSSNIQLLSGKIPLSGGPVDILSLYDGKIKFDTEPVTPATINIIKTDTNDICYSFIQNGSGQLNIPNNLYFNNYAQPYCNLAFSSNQSFKICLNAFLLNNKSRKLLGIIPPLFSTQIIKEGNNQDLCDNFKKYNTPCGL